MDPYELEVGFTYVVIQSVKVCLYNQAVEDCEFTNMIDLPSGKVLTYVGPDEDPGGGYIFEAEGNKYCFHDNDLDAIKES